MATATAEHKTKKPKAEKVQIFAWEGKDKKGNVVKGESNAANMTLVKAELRKQGIIPSKVKVKSELFKRARKTISILGIYGSVIMDRGLITSTSRFDSSFISRITASQGFSPL